VLAGVFETLTQRIESFATTSKGLIAQVWERIRDEDPTGRLLQVNAV